MSNNNFIGSLSSADFQQFQVGAPTVRSINMDSNQITDVENITHVLCSSSYAIETLSMKNNPLECSCSLLWIKSVPSPCGQVVLSPSPCASPPQAVGVDWVNVDEELLNCDKTTTTIESTLDSTSTIASTLESGSNIFNQQWMSDLTEFQ